jgi:plasmid maintenance system killer protein
VTVRANWRIIFRFEGNDAFDAFEQILGLAVIHP